MNPSQQKYLKLVDRLRKLPRECEWVEFKMNKSDENEIGEYISALSNSAALIGEPTGYLIWGIDDKTHEIRGTSFRPQHKKHGNEELESWLSHRLTPTPHFQFHVLKTAEKTITLLEIQATCTTPVSFDRTKYIRIGSYKKKLMQYPEKERKLWQLTDKTSFETVVAKEYLYVEEALELLDYHTYFSLYDIPIPMGHEATIESLIRENIIVDKNKTGDYAITNLGAVLFAKDFKHFPNLFRKNIRVVRYKGKNRIETTKERELQMGYASGFEGLIGYILSISPSHEAIEQSLRKTKHAYPHIIVRELVANALMHQDFYTTGVSLTVEVFDDRIEITNPGRPLIDINRFLDNPSKSRNEKMASLLRYLGICEERGTGIDKVVYETEHHQLPAPLFEVGDDFTRVTIFSYKAFDDMSKEDRVRACYLHCCLLYVEGRKMTNGTLRKRFGLEAEKSSIVTRIINFAVRENLIVNLTSSASRRHTSYAPYWSVSDN